MVNILNANYLHGYHKRDSHSLKLKLGQKYRDKLVHGKEFGNAINVEKATLSILKILEDQEWIKEIKFSVKSKTHSIHEIYERKSK